MQANIESTIVRRLRDFFERHVDSTDNMHHFGTIALNIPTMAAYNDALKAVQGPQFDEVDTCPTFASDDYDDSWEPRRTLDDVKATNRIDASEGSLNFYMARELSTSISQGYATGAFGNSARHERYANHADASEHAGPDALEVSADLTKYCPDDIIRSRATVSAGGTPPTLPLNYAAWLTDVVHEVMPVHQGYRVVMTYKLFKKGTGRMRIPLWTEMDCAINKVFKALRAMEKPARKVIPTTGTFTPMVADVVVPDSIAVLLRHMYPPAGLHPTALKGLDAVLYQVASHRRDCYLVSGLECREELMGNPWHLREQPFGRVAVATTDPNNDAKEKGTREDGLLDTLPVIGKASWIQLGHGRLLTGGSSYGNWDCGAPWWYRETILVIRPELSAWRRRRWVFLVHASGDPAWRRLLKHWYIKATIIDFL
jgi:hypothetical protein